VTPVGTQPVTGELTGEWAPVGGSDGQGVLTVLPETGTVVFGNDRYLQASGGCGGFGKPQPLNENLIVEPAVATKYCLGPTDADTRISKNLGAVTSALVGETLYLTGEGFELELEPVPAVDSDDLQGEWEFTMARQSDTGMSSDNRVTLTVDGSTLTADCVSGTLDPVSGLNSMKDLVVTGGCADLLPDSLDHVFATPFLVHLTGSTLEIVDPCTSTFYTFSR
jgi:hypothetical protein